MTVPVSRTQLFAQLAQPFDLLVIGGGITGAGIALEASRRGLKTLLVEQRDFAWGTSSRSSKLVHGGLRYLKQGALHLTRESVLERQQLLREAPGLVEPQSFAFADYPGRKPGKLMLDRSMNAPVRYTPGFMHGEKRWSLFGFNTPQAFGHLGFINILCWADPERDISVAFLNTGKSLAPEGFLGFGNVSRMISQVIPRDAR